MSTTTSELKPLDKKLRGKLEDAVWEAREQAEEAARGVCEQLGVGRAKSDTFLTDEQRELRRRLRIHGRQLGDKLNPKTDEQEIERLVEEIAYQHWHRMLFARFLAENQLLMYPDPEEPVPVSLEDCEELAADEGAKNGWELAARFATRMLPQVFRVDSPVFDVALPPENQQRLEQLHAELPEEVFTASDSLGWVYQFWQSKRKDEVNESEVKIAARELPAVTQLFTEPYMVSFLLDNSLGAWWWNKVSTNDTNELEDGIEITDEERQRREQQLRNQATRPNIPLTYLRFVPTSSSVLSVVESSPVVESSTWTPAAGTFPSWPDSLADFKVLDPCCGSGHFLVAALLMLTPMRMELEGLSAREAIDRVLSENLHGLEIDQRCVELAAFALALTAWRYPGAGGYRPLPELNVACCGLSVSAAKQEWKQLGLGKQNLTIALDWMHEEFADAPLLGSLLDPQRSDSAKLVQWSELQGTIAAALEREQGEERREAAVVAHGLAKAATMLVGRYDWVVTNVPYLARGKQTDRLRKFCETHYPAAKNDLATVFLRRCLDLCREGGTTSVALPQNWLFLTSYRKFREQLLKGETWHLIARLGPGAFETISGEVVKAILITLSRGNASGADGDLFAGGAESTLIRGVDVSEPRTAAEKAADLVTAEVKSVEQEKQLENPDAVITDKAIESAHLLSDYASSIEGLSTGDGDRFVRAFWETGVANTEWERFVAGSECVTLFSGMTFVLHWNHGEGSLSNFPGARIQGHVAWNKPGILVGQMRSLPRSLYTGDMHTKITGAIIPKTQSHLSAIWAFCSDDEYFNQIRRINQKLSVATATLTKVPFDLEHWTKVAEDKYPHGLPKPYTDDPTQWIFHGHPCGSVVWDEESKWTAHGPLRTDETVLQVAVARLLGYRWPAELDPEMELADEQREWVRRCDELLSFADEDGIVCIPPLRGEPAAADRLLNLLATAYGDQWSNDILNRLLLAVDHGGKPLETWLRDKFFTQHCKLFQNRPFIWHIWDGLKDGFSALVNYHRLDNKTLQSLIYSYLNDWIRRQEQDREAGIDGSEEKLAAAEGLKLKLEKILEGESPHDIFVRWKPLEEQPIGWNPDLNDGVRLNIRPFLTVGDVKKRGAGVLRDKPNIHWKKDRGKDVESAPWHHLGPQYAGKPGDRINDHHLKLAEKRTARAEARRECERETSQTTIT